MHFIRSLTIPEIEDCRVYTYTQHYSDVLHGKSNLLVAIIQVNKEEKECLQKQMRKKETVKK